MQMTDNFDLKLYEGADIFNPLTVENDNMEKIDEQMAKNYAGTVGLATELKNGTVHALTRVDDTPVFRFVATSNYSSGDTFTVDGLQVSGLLADGRTLADGAYVINSNVLCCLTGTVLTFYVTAGNVELAADSEKLGGELPSFYGTASDVAQARSIAQAASVLSNQLNDKLTVLPTGTLSIGSTSVTINDLSITESGLIDIYVSKYGLSPKTVNVFNGGITMTFDAQSDVVYVKVRCL